MARTNWLTWLKNHTRSQNAARRRRKPALLGGIRDWQLEERCLLSGPQPTSIFVGTNEYFIGNNVKSDANDVLLISGKGMASGSYDWGTVPTKLFTFTNNNPKGGATIYPFLYDANNIQQYDPADPLHQEYRLYVGYTQDGKDYLGLPAGQSITINVPLVFWNAARANVATDGANLLPKDDQQGNFLPGIINPYGFYYRDQGPTNKGTYAAISIAPAESGGNGIVMYYRGTNNAAPVDPVDDAQGQLLEWTIRDQPFMTNKVNDYNSQNGIPLIPASDLLTHINYDVSNVDNLSSPVAMEATQVPVPIQYVQSGTIKSIQQNGSTTTTTIQLMNNIPADQAFLLQLMNSQPQGGPKPSWQLYYQKDAGSPKIDIGTVTNADQNTGLLTVTLNGGNVPQSLLNQNLGLNFFTDDVKQDYGYTGTKLSYTDLQNQLQAFTSSNTDNNGLGQYFNGLGWPQYYYPNSSVVRIPGGAFLFADSPLNDVSSSYFPLAVYNMLTSNNGVARNQYSASVKVDSQDNPLKANTTYDFKNNTGLPLTKQDLQDMKTALDKGAVWNVIGADFKNKQIGTIVGIDPDTGIIKIKLGQSSIDNLPSGYSMVFQIPVADPYAVKLRDLWYSWANYYAHLPQFKDFSSTVTAKSITGYNDPGPDNDPSDTRIVTFDTPQKQLALGMKVTGDGINNLVTIEKISADFKTIYLSQAVTPGNSISLTFLTPADINTYPGTGKYPTPPVNLNLIDGAKFKGTFNGKFIDYTNIAQEFAASVYETMALYSTIATPTIPNLPGSMGVVYESIGGGVGHLPPQSQHRAITADVRDLGKSVLRGVPDFNKYPNLFTTDAQWQPGYWNPPPSTKTDGANYNVFNLDPYVWFIHQKLGLSGYGFSFDDDAADIGANGTGTLAITYNGLNGLKNQAEWHVNNKWGPVSSPVTISRNPSDSKSVIVSFDKSWQGIIAYWEVTANDPKNGVPGSYVTGPASAGIINNPKANPPLFTQLTANGDSNALQKLMGPLPNHTLPYSTVLTFSGTPPVSSSTFSSAPPPNNHRPPQANPATGGSASLFDQVVSLVVDDVLLVIDQMIAMTDVALGIVPNPALQSAITAYQNALNANPLHHSLFGLDLFTWIQLEILNLLLGQATS